MPKNAKGDWPGLYKKFFDSLNFKCWYEQKKLEAERKLESLQTILLCDYVRLVSKLDKIIQFKYHFKIFHFVQDMGAWLQGKHEIEIIDQYMNVKRKLVTFKLFFIMKLSFRSA